MAKIIVVIQYHNSTYTHFIFRFIPTENMRFREEALSFKVSENATEEEVRRVTKAKYPDMSKTMGSFQ